MKNIISNVTDFVNSKITTYAAIKQNVFPNESTEELICRIEPSQPEKTFLDGTKSGMINFSYYAKSLSQQTAETQLKDILAVLDNARIGSIDEGLFIKVEASTLVYFVSKTESGESIFTVGFKLEYIYKEV